MKLIMAMIAWILLLMLDPPIGVMIVFAVGIIVGTLLPEGARGNK